jgi:fatty-acyl-CoA synthase
LCDDVPVMFQFMAQHANFADTNLSGLHILICGAAPCPESLLKTWKIPRRADTARLRPDRDCADGEFPGAGGRAVQNWLLGTPPPFTEVKLVNVDGKPVSEPRVKARFLRVGPM